MSLRALVTRTEPDAHATAARLSAAGAAPILAPLLRIEPRQGNVDLAGAQALLFTSANGVRAFAAQTPARALPALCVGAATAAAADEAGFTDVRAAGGDVAALAALAAGLAPERGALLHVSGAHMAGDIAAALAARGFSTDRRIFYEAVAAARFPQDVLERLRAAPPGLDIVLFHSARAAHVFCALAQALAPNAPGALIAACLSPMVARSASALAWRALVTAPKPNDEALIAAALAAGRSRP